jgi:membrane protein DedA with SNARE-associated domain
VLSGLAEWVAGVVDQLGYVGLLLLVALENLFPPLPSELILPLAGFLVGQARMDFLLAFAFATAGSVLGAVLLYGIGALVGEDRIRRWVRRIPLLEERDVDIGQRWFARHGGKAVFFGRLVPIVRSVISLPAGLERMPMWRFVVFTTAGSALWNLLLIGGGWYLGDRWEEIRPWISRYEIVVIVVVAIAFVAFVAYRFRRWRRRVDRTGS